MNRRLSAGDAGSVVPSSSGITTGAKRAAEWSDQPVTATRESRKVLTEFLNQRLRLSICIISVAHALAHMVMQKRVQRHPNLQPPVSACAPFSHTRLTLTLAGGKADSSWYASSRAAAPTSCACSADGTSGGVSEPRNARRVEAAARAVSRVLKPVGRSDAVSSACVFVSSCHLDVCADNEPRASARRVTRIPESRRGPPAVASASRNEPRPSEEERTSAPPCSMSHPMSFMISRALLRARSSAKRLLTPFSLRIEPGSRLSVSSAFPKHVGSMRMSVLPHNVAQNSTAHRSRH
jgi:hypothetical protein